MRVPRSVTSAIASLLAFAVGSREAHALRERPFYQASRALAMGDAYTAYDVGFEAVYYNPAGVANKNKPSLKFFDIEGTVSQGAFSTLSDTVGSLTSFSLLEFKKTVLNNVGNVQAGGVGFFPQFIIKNFSIGAIARGYAEGFVEEDTLDMHLYSFTDLGMYAQFGIAMMGGVVKFGIGGKVIDRAELNRVISSSEAATDEAPAGWAEGIGYGVDAGLLIALPVYMLPTLGIAVQDIGGTTFQERRMIWGADAEGVPAPIKQRVNVGLAVHTKQMPGFKTGLSFEVKDVLNKDKVIRDRMHAGMEVTIKELLYLRGGINEGQYWTAGAGLYAGRIGVEVATYGENISGDADTVLVNRNWILRYVSKF